MRAQPKEKHVLDMFTNFMLPDAAELLGTASDVGGLVKPFMPAEAHNDLLLVFAQIIVAYQFGDITEQEARDEIAVWGALVLMAA